MMKLQFRAKPFKTGSGSWVVIIPKAYIKNKQIPTDKKICITIDECGANNNEKTPLPQTTIRANPPRT